MARPSKEPPSPSPLVPALARYLRSRGIDLRSLVAALPADVEAKDEMPTTATGWNDLLAVAADALGEPYLALHLPADLPLLRYGLAELTARASATLRDALSRMARYAALVQPQLACALEEEGAEAIWRQRTPAHPRGVGRFASEYPLAYALTHGRRESGLPLPALRVWFAHARPSDIAPLHRFFGTRELAFGHDDCGFALPREWLDRPMPSGDARLLATATDLAEAALRAQPRAQQLETVVAAKLEAMLPGDASMEAVAQALHMSPRTLQRRMEQEGTRFSEVLDGVREGLARRLIADPSLSLVAIADRLGFADLATFSRAFKRWTGKPPGTWRRS